MRFPRFKRLVHRGITHFSSMEFLSTYENELISADHGRFWRSVVAKNCNFLPPFQSQAMRCKIRTRWAIRIIFFPVIPHVSYFYNEIIWIKRAETGALTKLWMALKHKKLMKKTYCNDLFELRANKRTPFRPLFSNDPMVNIWHMGYHWIKKLSS